MNKKIIIVSLTIILAIALVSAWIIYSKAFVNNVNLEAKAEKIIYLPTGGNIQNLYDTLEKYEIIDKGRL